MDLNVITADGSAKSVSVADAIFAKELNKDLVHQVVVAYQAGARQGSKAQKTRAEVSGGGAKPWRQKGMGRARAGTIRSPIWVGGGRAFAAKPRSYEQKINRKMYRSAICVILSKLAADQNLKITDGFSLAEPKTKALTEKLSQMNISNALIVCEEIDINLYLAARNLPHINVIDVASINPVELLSYENVLLTTEALKQVEERFK